MKEIADNWQMEITEISWAYEQLLNAIPGPAFNMRKTPEMWSPGEIIDHLYTLNASYFPIFDSILAGNYHKPLAGYVPFLATKVGEMLLKAMQNPKKTKTLPLWEPRHSLIDPVEGKKFLDQQDQLSAYIEKLDPYLEKNLIIASPASRFVVYPLDQAIAILLAHEKRHLQQLEETMIH
nr:DinB family protein [Cytophagales bacterium]